MTDASPATRPAVSVVVPVWNPGPNLRRCVDSLLAQTMAPADYEIVLVDDGSTDGTAQRLDALAAAQPQRVRVLHIPASGWPGKPRNVGIDAARGEYVHLVDNDDILPPYALAELYDAARAAGADVVMGRPASDFRGLNHTVYRRTIPSCVLVEFPQLTETLTPHKMFRRDFLHEHGIRFPEGPVPLEDQMFVMRAYLHARAITVLSDRPYYFYLRRIGSGRNAGDRRIDPVKQCAATEQVLDIIEETVADPQLRDRLFRRFYRINLLARLSEQSLIDNDDEWRQALVDEIRRVTTTRFGPGVRDGVGAANRVQGRLLLDHDLPALITLAGHYRAISVEARAAEPRWRDGRLVLDIDARLQLAGEPLRCERAGDGWALPAELAPGVPVADRLLDRERDEPDVELSLVSRVSAVSFGIVDGLRVEVDDAGVICARGTVVIDPETALAGRPVTDGLWDVRVRLRFGGWNRAAAVIVDPADTGALVPVIDLAGRTVLPYVTESTGALVLDVGQWHTSLAAAVALTAELTARGRRRVHLSLSAYPASTPPPGLQLLLEPQDGTPDGLVACPASLHPESGRGVATVRLPALPADGTWRPWLRLADAGAGPAVPLPWLLRTAGRDLRVERIAEA